MQITVYESRLCGFCHAAKRLLDKKGWEYELYLVDGQPAIWDEMVKRSGRDTVPQIFIGDKHIGGFDDLAALDAAGDLDQLYQE